MEEKTLQLAESIYETAKQLPEDYQLIGAVMLMGLATKALSENSEEEERKGA